MSGATMIHKFAWAAAHPIDAISRLAQKRYCSVCGHFCRRELRPASFQPAELVEGHGYTEEWTHFMNLREAEVCKACETSGRSHQIAKVLLERYGVRARTLEQLVRENRFRSLAVAEINQCAQLHRYLRELPRLSYSEYGSTDPKVPNEDILNLSYPDGTFDLVLTSDTLEHVPDCERALTEIHRVLKPGGYHIFTIPVVWDQEVTRRRAYIENGELVHVVKPVYHGGSLNPSDCLAFYDYGADILDIVRNIGFEVELYKHPRNRALRTLISRRPG